MDSSDVVTVDQLPDENYIERLFPKCPPKQANFSGNKRSIRTKDGQRKLVRSRVHQHSRRELEARRNKIKLNSKEVHNNSSETSDDNSTRSSKKNSYNSQYNSGDSQRTRPSALPSSSSSSSRRTSRHMASQSLMQQLQRSQSHYNNVSVSSTSPSLENSNRNNTQVNQANRANKHESGGITSKGIVKSASSYPFFNEQKTTYAPKSYQQATNSLALEGRNDNGQPNKVAGKNNNYDNNNNNNGFSDLTDKEFSLNSDSRSIQRKADANSNLNSALCAMSASSPTQSADLAFREKIDAVKRDSIPLNINTTAVNTSQTIISPILDKSNIDDVTKKQDNHEINYSNLIRRDDDKYINLFVYDNATHQLHKSQLLPTEEADKQQHEINQLKNTRYRPRNDRPSDNIEPNETVEVRCEPTKDPKEIVADVVKEDKDLIETEEPAQSEVITSQPSTIDQTRTEAVKFRQDLEIAPSIIAVQHHASQQLLASGTNENDEALIKNDASTEELCSVGDGDIDDGIKISNLKKIPEHENQRLILERQTNSLVPAHRPSLSPSTLQTVDEGIENPNEEFKTDTQVPDKTVAKKDSDTMPANQPNLTKKGFVPPGYPQRVSPKIQAETSPLGEGAGLVPIKDTKVSNVASEKHTTVSTPIFSSHDRSLRSTRPENHQHVKFDEENLVNLRNSQTIHSELCTDKLPAICRRNEHFPQMPSISEAQSESEIEVVSRNDQVETSELDLSIELNKMSLTNSSFNQEVPCDANYRGESSTENFQAPPQLSRLKESNLFAMEPEHTLVQHSLEAKGLELDASLPNLRHHKLPNETSHYSIVRANNCAIPSNAINNAPPRSSSIQFNVLSEGESGPDESVSSSTRQLNPSHRGYNAVSKKCDPSPTVNSSVRGLSGASSSQKNEDDLLPTTKTALIFPRLDEGLSSEAESLEDDVEDEDEKAVDADVDADDDEDDDDIDDDFDTDTLNIERSAHSIQLTHPNVDPFLRQQQMKPHNRMVSSLQHQHQPQQQQHGSNISNVAPEHNELPQVSKSPCSTYGGYIGQEPLDHNDLKPMTNYSNQNGQSNYWVGASNHQPNMSSQPSPSQHFNQRAHSSNNTSSNNNSFNREEAKATNRLSSDTDNETDRLLGSQRNDQLKMTNNDVNSNNSADLQPVSSVTKQNANSREVLIEGVLFNVKYLGSTHSDCEGRSEKEDRIHQAEMAVHEVKFRNGESQAATEVQLFISTEKIMVLDDKHRKIMMDHSLRTISYIADIGDAIVLIVRKKNSSNDINSELGRPVSKISCHVFESSESHTITKSISQAFQVAYTELLKANGTGDTSSYLPKELDYQEVLNSQEMSTDELEMFARKENQREVIVPKKKGEILGLSIVESGWGSVLPTVVIANLKPDGPAYRCKRLSIGDQILSVNGISLVGLPLAECQEILRKTKNQSVARLSVVPCPITVEVKIKRPDTKYQLGFSVQNGVICSLLRGGIAERGGVRVGHRIMSINGTTVVGVPHEKIVTLLASSVGEIRMKTCLTSLYRLILGEENPVLL